MLEWISQIRIDRTPGGYDLWIFLLANFAVFVDLLDMSVRAWIARGDARLFAKDKSGSGELAADAGGDRAPVLSAGHCSRLQPYALLVSVHNAAGAELENFLAAAGPYRHRLWVIDDASTDDTWRHLQESGIRCIRNERNLKKPHSIKRLLAVLPAEIVTVIVLDPDARIVNPVSGDGSSVEKILADFQSTGMAAMCPRLAVREENGLTRIQAFEYSLAFNLGRRSLGIQTITSGIAVYRRDALERVLDQHTLSVYAEDLENALILLKHGDHVYYERRLVVETEGKASWRGWFSQRVGWWFGLLKVAVRYWPVIVNRATLKRLPCIVSYHYVFYVGMLTLLLHPVKMASLLLLALGAAIGLSNAAGLGWIAGSPVIHPAYCLFGYFVYTAMISVGFILAVERGDRRRLLPIIPLYFFYVLAQIVPVTIGYLNWFFLQVRGRRLFRDHYQDDVSITRGQATGDSL